MKKSELNSFFSSFNLFIIIIGYPIVTILLLPMSGGGTEISRQITVPYRLFSVILACIVILLNIKKKKQFNKEMMLLWVFLIAYLLKMFWSLSLTGTSAAIAHSEIEYYLYYIGLGLIPVLSIIYSYDKIDYYKVFKYACIVGIVVLLVSIFNVNTDSALNEVNSTDARQVASLGLGSIAYGHFGISIALMSLYSLFLKNTKWMKVLYILGVALGFFVAVRAASRGPFVAFVFVVFVIILTRSKKMSFNILISILFLCLTFIFYESIDSIIEIISPAMHRRLELMQEGDSSLRDELFRDAWNQFLESPIFGQDFVLNRGETGKGYYPHNLILESLIALGLLGGVLIIYLVIKGFIISFKSLLYRKNEMALVSMLFLQTLVGQMFSGSIYTGATVFTYLALLFCLNNQKKKNSESIECE